MGTQRGGGFATADAMFRFPDFFKVGWSESGNHDNRNYEDDWAEKWMGLDDASNKQAYDDQANENIAKNLKGKLMLVHGHHGRQRTADQHAAGRRRVDEGRQGLLTC